ncbi:MAG TPA: FMN-binding protein [Clostridiaceae bacterium]|nr:FMN-binding protein [Clostridiaceae bacterium]
MRTVFRVILAFILFVVVAVGVMFVYMTRGMDELQEAQVRSIAPLSLEDGVYRGEFDSGRWANTVEVTVKDRKIIDIALVEDVTFSRTEISDGLFREVIEKQDLTVDIVSGATMTCKAYLVSLDRALAK